MAREIETEQPGLTGSTLYALLNNAAGLRWNGTTFEAIDASHWSSYVVALAEAAGTGVFAADRPAGIPAGTRLSVRIRKRVGGSPAASDPVVADGAIGPEDANIVAIENDTDAAHHLWEDETSPTPTIPTATQVADAVLTRDWTAITATVPARSTLNALRWLRNAWAIASGVLTVKKEDDSTTAWSKPVTEDAAADPVTGAGVG